MNDVDKSLIDAESKQKSFVLHKRKKSDRKTRKMRFNALDVFVVVMILLATLSVSFRDMIAEFLLRAEPTESIEIAFVADGLTNGEVAAFSEGQAFYLDDEQLGSLGSFTVLPSKTVVEKTDSEGTLYFDTVPDREHYTVSGTMLVSVRYTDGGVALANSVPIYVGKILNIYSTSLSVTVTITEIPQN